MAQPRDELATKQDLGAVEMRLTAKIDANAEKIDEVEQRLTARIAGNAEKIETNSRKIEENSRKIDRLTREVVNIRVRMDEMMTREEFERRFDEIIRGQDKMMTILTRWDGGRAAILTRIERLEQKA